MHLSTFRADGASPAPFFYVCVSDCPTSAPLATVEDSGQPQSAPPW